MAGQSAEDIREDVFRVASRLLASNRVASVRSVQAEIDVPTRPLSEALRLFFIRLGRLAGDNMDELLQVTPADEELAGTLRCPTLSIRTAATPKDDPKMSAAAAPAAAGEPVAPDDEEPGSSLPVTEDSDPFADPAPAPAIDPFEHEPEEPTLSLDDVRSLSGADASGEDPFADASIPDFDEHDSPSTESSSAGAAPSSNDASALFDDEDDSDSPAPSPRAYTVKREGP